MGSDRCQINARFGGSYTVKTNCQPAITAKCEHELIFIAILAPGRNRAFEVTLVFSNGQANTTLALNATSVSQVSC